MPSAAIKCVCPQPAAIELARDRLYLAASRKDSRSKVMPVKALLNLLSRTPNRAARVPDGLRVYAIGDIHGRLDLLDELLEILVADDQARGGSAETHFIFLGDLIDRGPESSGVVERLMAFAANRPNVRFLMGNHEQVFLHAMSGDRGAMRFFNRIGGRETLLSYGITEEDYRALDFDELTALAKAKVPAEHLAFLSGFEKWIELGDYLFVHAGLRPGVPLEQQEASDLCWIRQEFLDHRESFDRIVVHGHSITEEIDVRANRIGIDTGAFASGRLTALGLEGAERWFLST